MEKQRILDEIDRTAATNGGTPLGQEAFSRKTGINKMDWFGVYWSRWSDALKEAGYAPNEYIKGYSDEQIIEYCILLTRELKRFPVSGDIRIKHRSNPDFPGHGVFDRFGKKNLVSQVRAYCASRPDFADVLVLCPASAPPTDASTSDAASDFISEGYVYLLKSGSDYKIGCTKELDRRSKELRVQMPDPTEYVHFIRTDDQHGIEAYWHKRFKNRRKNGEWFGLTQSDIKAFCRRRFM